MIFATGTPLSNSMTEMYTLMRYLQYNTLQQKGLTHFDAWASTFGETTTAIELAPEGTGYRARTRFAKFFNLPELMAMFKEAADIKTSDQLHLPVPDAKFETVVVKPSEIQQDMVQALSERAAEVHSGSVDPSVDNMLKITSDGRKIGLDQRLMNSALPDDPNSKLNACVNNVLRIWNDTKEQKLTQLIFCDMSTPKGTVRSTSMMIFAPSCSTPVCPNRRSSSSTTQIRRTRKQNFSPRYAADRCVCCWAALPKWEQGPTSRRCS